MPVTLRVLLVEDYEDDALLIVRHLSKHGYEPDWVRVQTRERLAEELTSREWDVILCDYKMPRFNAPEALQTVQELGLDVPFIVVSGTVREDIAVECMRAGAADFVSKSNLGRLSHAIAREVRDAGERRARRNAEQALRRSAENARKIIAVSMDGMVVVDARGVVRFANPSAMDMLGQNHEGLVGLPFDVPVVLGHDEELDLSERSGRKLVVETDFSEVQWEDQSVYLVTLHDVTDREIAEEQLRNSFVSLADTLSIAMASRDAYTTHHQRRVAELVEQVGERCELSEEELWNLRMSALLHDIGKVAVPDSILTKPGRLSREEMDLVRTHVSEGYRILQSTGLPAIVPQTALHHHEVLDGTGYPQGLSGEELTVQDRILSLCNVVEAMGSHRPHRPAHTAAEVIAEIRKGRGLRYDAAIADMVLDILESGAFVLGG